MNNEDRYRELMDRELDGATTPEESAALKGYLAANPEARRQFDELAPRAFGGRRDKRKW